MPRALWLSCVSELEGSSDGFPVGRECARIDVYLALLELFSFLFLFPMASPQADILKPFRLILL